MSGDILNVAPAGLNTRTDIVHVELSSITIGTRKRQYERWALDQLKASLLVSGLLQPIGVRARGTAYELVYGGGRLTALRELLNDGKIFDSTVSAVVYPESTPDWQIEVAELAENLLRQELTSAERDAWTLQYIGLVKQHCDIAPANSRHGIATGRVVGDHSSPNGSEKKPTVVEKVAGDLGIGKDVVHNRAARAAKSVGTVVSVERTAAARLLAVGKDAAAKARTSNGGVAPDSKIAKLLAKEEQRPGVTTGDVVAGVEAWWASKHPNGEVVFREVRGTAAAD